MKYFYSGPFSAVTLQTAKGPQDVVLHPDNDVDLPEDHPYTKTLVALKHLTKPVATASEVKAPSKSAKEGA